MSSDRRQDGVLVDELSTNCPTLQQCRMICHLERVPCPTSRRRSTSKGSPEVRRGEDAFAASSLRLGAAPTLLAARFSILAACCPFAPGGFSLPSASTSSRPSSGGAAPASGDIATGETCTGRTKAAVFGPCSEATGVDAIGSCSGVTAVAGSHSRWINCRSARIPSARCSSATSFTSPTKSSGGPIQVSARYCKGTCQAFTPTAVPIDKIIPGTNPPITTDPPAALPRNVSPNGTGCLVVPRDPCATRRGSGSLHCAGPSFIPRDDLAANSNTRSSGCVCQSMTSGNTSTTSDNAIT